MKSLLLSCCFFLSGWAAGQGIGLHPPEVNWQQLRADHVRVIFPEGYAASAQRVASLVDRLAAEHTRSVGERLYDFDLILQTPNMTVNGYVGLGPFRSEFYVTPPQTFSRLSNTDWVDLLTIHEFRHVQQTSNERRGLTRLASLVQGQLGWAVLSGIATPNWFSEGDAVVAETALTAAGRGRTPAFSKDLRALLGRDIVYRYAKARNGSFRDLVPDHYRYGYAMITYGRERFGNDVWKPVLQEGAAFRGLFYPFSRALKRQTGLTTRDIYYRTMADLEQQQDSTLARRRPLVEGEPLGGTDRDVRDYRFAFTDGQGHLLALRSSYEQLPALVEVGSPDRVITRTGIQREPWLAGSRRFVLWTQYAQDPRYTNQSYSDLVVYELSSGRRRTLTAGGHYLSARFSPDERRIAAVWFDPLEDGPQLHLLDAATGEVIARRTVAANNVAWPCFSADGEQVFFLEQTPEGIAIQAWRPATDAVTTLHPRSAAPIDMLTVTDAGDLLFTGGASGVDNVYRLPPDGGSPQPLTDVAIGAYYPSVTDGRLYYASPTPRGERLRILDLPTTGEGREITLPTGPSFFERPAAFAAEATDLPTELTVRDYPVRNFSNTLGGVKLHSWSFNGSYVTPGLAIEAANALNTAAVTLDGRYNINEARYSGGLSVAYGGLYPVLELEGRYRARNIISQVAGVDSFAFRAQEFDQLSLGPVVNVPLQWVSGNTYTNLQPSVGLQYYHLRDAEEGVLPGNFTNLSLGMTFGVQQQQAYRQVQPRWGALATVAYDRALSSDRAGERLLLRSSIYLPGLLRTHGIRLDLDAQTEQAENLYQYPDLFRYARGYAASLNDRVFRFGVNYHLPVVYPDLGILGITYFKRIRFIGFFDYSRFTLDQPRELSFNQRSVGGQLFFDNVWLNAQLLPVGIEVAYRLDQDVFSSDPQDVQVRLLLTGSF
ncbi:hypothetical protein [Lewinella sp. IMCC34183]|uniref:hypothetical protein n=1 Tax=Lewinella sp. IMCC34183 TaxID=2248762 RepID=UPI000E2227FA|nr:hypothetical protein [Lewinella sp. IMCC34183]